MSSCQFRYAFILVGKKSRWFNLLWIQNAVDILNLFFICFTEESLSVDPFKNSLKLFEHWEVLECLSHDRIKLYYLSDKYDSERSLQKVFERVKRFKCSPVASGGSWGLVPLWLQTVCFWSTIMLECLHVNVSSSAAHTDCRASRMY
jgi:hypothetical protein